jgi:hypothetical protein
MLGGRADDNTSARDVVVSDVTPASGSTSPLSLNSFLFMWVAKRGTIQTKENVAQAGVFE